MTSTHTFTEPALIFLHLPKSGGTTLHSIIDRQYPASQVYTIDGTRTRASLAEFVALLETERAQLRVLKGHMPFGMHVYLPRPATYITLLRDPIDRAISHYYHILRSPHHTHYAAVKDMDLETFIRSGISRIPDNGQVRMLAACEEEPFGEIREKHLVQAIANLEQYFSVVGLTERFDESLVLMMRRFGWRVKVYTRRNVGRNRLPSTSVPLSTRQIIAEHNRYDRQLVAYAEKRMKAEITSAGVSFYRALFALRLSNRLRHWYQARRGIL